MTKHRVVRGLVAGALAGVLALPIHGCGFLLTQGPPAGHRRMDHFSCTESNAAPVLDVVWGGFMLYDALHASESAYSLDRNGYARTYLALGALSVTSAAVGFGRTRRCRAAGRELVTRMAQLRRDAIAPTSSAWAVETVIVSPSLDTVAVGGILHEPRPKHLRFRRAGYATGASGAGG